MRKITLSAAALAMVVTIAACNNNNDTAKDSKEAAKQDNPQNNAMPDSLSNDVKFAINAADGGLMEVQLGKLAQTNASAADVKAFGQHMIDDHSKANEELKALATRKNIAIPATLSNKNQADYDDLAKKQGKDFDKAYSDYMVKDHKGDIDEFKKEASDGKDADIKSWAAGKVATLEMHLQMAQAASNMVGK